MKRTFISALIIIFVITILSGIGIYLFSLEEKQAGTETLPIVVNTKLASQQNSYPLKINYTGQVEARRQSQLGFELGGKVIDIYVDEGDEVEADTLLAELDTELLDSQKQEMLARKDQAEADLELARLTLARREESWEGGAITRQAYDEARQNFLAKQAAVNSIDAQIDSIDTRLNKSTLSAPYTAVISQRLLDEGTVVQAGQPILNLVEKNVFEARVGMQNEIIQKLEMDNIYQLNINDATYTAIIKSVLPIENRNTRTVDVIFDLEANHSLIRQGDLVNWTYEETIDETGFWLPMAALTESSRGLWACYVVVQDGTQTVVKRRELEIVHQLEELMYVTGTLQENDRVVINGIHRLVPNLPVRLHEEINQ